MSVEQPLNLLPSYVLFLIKSLLQYRTHVSGTVGAERCLQQREGRGRWGVGGGEQGDNKQIPWSVSTANSLAATSSHAAASFSFPQGVDHA